MKFSQKVNIIYIFRGTRGCKNVDKNCIYICTPKSGRFNNKYSWLYKWNIINCLIFIILFLKNCDHHNIIYLALTAFIMNYYFDDIIMSSNLRINTARLCFW